MPILSLLAAIPPAVAQTAPPAPPPVVASVAADRGPQLVVLRPGEARCAGMVEVPVFREPALPVARNVYTREPARPVTIAFSIAADGRPIDIARIGAPQSAWPSDDAAPSLAVWRFAPGAPRTGCTVTFAVNHLRAPDVPIDEAYRAFATRRGDSRAMQPFYGRTIPAGSDCFRPFPMLRVQAFPAYDEIEQRPGHWATTMIGFDVDRRGRTHNVATLDGDPAEALSREGRRAVRATRFAPGARHGCALPFAHLSPAPLEAPPSPETSDFRDPAGHCEGLPGEWASMPLLRFPPAFNRRNIEGWAIVRFDVAPWGQTGNVTVVKAQPAVEFGEAAIRVVASARKPPSPRGFSGCVDKVVFHIRPGGAAVEGADEIVVR